jgi:hypothetical protein
MRRLILGAMIGFAAAAAVAAQPPAATPPAAPAAAGTDLYPIKAGSKWTYKVGDATTVEMKVEKAEAGEFTLGTYVNAKQVASETVKVEKDGVVRSKINGQTITPPVKFLSLPAAKGTKWKIDSKITINGTEHSIKGEFECKDLKEKIKVKDKEYETVLVEGPEFETAGTKSSVKYWFAPGKGVVKLSYSIAGNEAILELAEYAEGK